MDQNTVKERDDGLDGLESYLGSLFELTSQWEQREKLRGSYHLFFKKNWTSVEVEVEVKVEVEERKGGWSIKFFRKKKINAFCLATLSDTNN